MSRWEDKVPVDERPHTLRQGTRPGGRGGSDQDVSNPGVNFANGPTPNYSDDKKLEDLRCQVPVIKLMYLDCIL